MSNLAGFQLSLTAPQTVFHNQAYARPVSPLSFMRSKEARQSSRDVGGPNYVSALDGVDRDIRPYFGFDYKAPYPKRAANWLFLHKDSHKAGSCQCRH